MPSEVHLSYLTAVFTNEKALVEKRYYTNLRQLNSLPHPMNLHNFVYNRNGEYCIIHFCGISMKSWLSIFFDSSHFWLTPKPLGYNEWIMVFIWNSVEKHSVWAWNFFQVLFTTTRFSSVLSCEGLLISSFHRSANMWIFIYLKS